jgi:hypothetical protein
MKANEMKTHRFENGSLEKAKEVGGTGFRSLAVATTGKALRNSPTQCATPARRAPRRSKTAAEKPTTTIKAKFDVGFGNTLTIRGEGQGLSWDHGQPMVCADGSTWVWSGQAAGPEPVKFKVLINDQLWCRGEDFEAASGTEMDIVPVF